MAWLATDNAESYSNGNNIDGLNGGSDWSGAWSIAGGGTTVRDIVNTPTLQGSLCFHFNQINASSQGEVLRSYANTTSGTLSMIVRCSSATAGGMIFGFDETTTSKFKFAIDGANSFGFGTGHFVIVGAINTDLGTYSANTNYTIVIDYDNSTDKVRVSVDGGSSFSSFVDYESTATNLNRIRFRLVGTTGVVDYYFDDIKPYAPTNIKTINGLAKASVKTRDGLAIASVKSINGLT